MSKLAEVTKMIEIVPNVKECPYCHGIVDRHGHMLICRNCGAYGDTFTGLMEPPPPEKKDDVLG